MRSAIYWWGSFIFLLIFYVKCNTIRPQNLHFKKFFSGKAPNLPDFKDLKNSVNQFLNKNQKLGKDENLNKNQDQIQKGQDFHQNIETSDADKKLVNLIFNQQLQKLLFNYKAKLPYNSLEYIKKQILSNQLHLQNQQVQNHQNKQINRQYHLNRQQNSLLNKKTFILKNSVNNFQNLSFQVNYRRQKKIFSKKQNHKLYHSRFLQTSNVIKSKQFSGIGLYNQVPLNFIQGEVYTFRGVILTNFKNQNERAYQIINAVLRQKNKNNFIICTQRIQRNNEFEINCKLDIPGQYFLTIFPGAASDSFSLKLRTIITYIFSYAWIQVKTDFVSIKPKNLRLEVVNNHLFAFWDSQASLTNFTIYQKDQSNKIQIKLQYLISNYQTKFKLPLADYDQFLKKDTFIEISHAYSPDGTLYGISSKFGPDYLSINFLSFDHAYSQILESNVTIIGEIPWRVKVGQKVTINVTFPGTIRSEVLITEPDQNIRKIYLLPKQSRESTIKPGTPIILQISFMKPGTNIIQFNSVSGLALINRPFYVGEGYPLIPDYIDLEAKSDINNYNNSLIKIYEDYFFRTTSPSQKIRQPSSNSDIKQKRNFMLYLTNSIRKKNKAYGLNLDQELNIIAQKHCEDMVKNDYLSHVNLQGEGPDDRARRMGFKYPIGENIAHSTSLILGHLILQRSGIHLQNILQDKWSRIGIGICKTEKGKVKSVFLFSTPDLSKITLSRYQEERINKEIVNILMKNYANLIGQDVQMSKDISNWMQSTRSSQILYYLADRRKSIAGSLIGYNFVMQYDESWRNVVKNSKTIESIQDPTKFKYIGVSGKLKKKNETYQLECYIVFLWVDN